MHGVEDTTARRPCVFCQATENKLTKEHVWPKWMRRYIELGAGSLISRSRTHTTNSGEIVSENTWAEAPIDWQAKGPCKPCNEGWMERLEAETRPILIPMLQDQRVTLDARKQDTLAKWAALRTLIAQHGHPPGKRAISPETYHRFYRSRELPIGARIWIGRYSGAGAWPTDYRHVELFFSTEGRPEPTQPNGYAVAFTVGYVAFLHWGHEIEAGPGANIGVLSPFFVSIWPTGPAVEWPPAGLIEASELDAAIRYVAGVL